MIRTIAIAAALLLAVPAWAQDRAPSKAQAAQQQRMKSCNEQAGRQDLKGSERQAFMSECLSADSAAGGGSEGLTAQQARMRDCNAEASRTGLKGDERKAFMSDCLKN